jgi:GMP synthase-like glutamine amidotransferase
VRVLAIVHQSDAGPGVFADEIRAGGDSVEQWMLPDSPRPPADPFGYDAVMVLGGAMHADQEDRHPWLLDEKALVRELIEREVPLIGLCLGGQLLAAAAGAVPRRARDPEIGWRQVELTPEGAADPLLGPLAPRFEAFEWHSYEFPLPAGAVPLARTDLCLQACRVGSAAWAIQFHPEVSAADARAWIEGYACDEDAVRIGLDPIALGAETDAKIAAFNQLGRDLCRRWLNFARQPPAECPGSVRPL